MDSQKAATDRIKKMSTAILAWYDFIPNKQVLFVGDEDHALVGMLGDRKMAVSCCGLDELQDTSWRAANNGRFDYIISIALLEKAAEIGNILKSLFSLLNANGKLLLGMNNRLGIRYFCGDRDCYIERNFDGIEDYCQADLRRDAGFTGRMYSHQELKTMLLEAGFSSQQFFSVWPDLTVASHLFEEHVLPNEDMAIRLFPFYNDPDTIFINENNLYESMVDNGLWFTMANGYFIECSKDGTLYDVHSVTCSLDRDDRDALVTIVHGNDIVEKKAVFPDGQQRLKELIEHGEDLKSHGVPVVPAKLEGDYYQMPYVHAKSGLIYLRELLRQDIEAFLREMDKFRDLILQSSEHVTEDMGDGRGVVLKRGYFDMVPLNSFYVDGTFQFYDQEFYIENYPANVLLIRMVNAVYGGEAELDRIYPYNKVLERYDLLKYQDEWNKLSYDFLVELRNETGLADFYNEHRRNFDIINSNRFRMNYSAEKYQKLFVDIFHNAASRKLIIFGSGKYADQFMALFKADYPVYKIIDNNQKRWGDTLYGVEIVSPDYLRDLSQNEYKVIICIKNYNPIVKQLDTMGVTEYSIYDANREYPRIFKPIVQGVVDINSKPKKYHSGYVAGVFDLFHYGHLNILRRAKEQCDYLIVGVVSDRQVREYKKVEPFVPFEERLEIVKSCRYVDEANEIPFEHPDTDMAWKLYHFDVQFSGSDYEDDPVWLAKKKWLEERGSTMVFFPYTQSTSSTKLKKLITERLI